LGVVRVIVPIHILCAFESVLIRPTNLNSFLSKKASLRLETFFQASGGFQA
jgi:hypothetical protein